MLGRPLSADQWSALRCGNLFSRRGDSRIARRPVPVSDKRAVEGAGPYDADEGFPVGEGLAPPADLRERRTCGRPQGSPLRRGRTFPTNSEFRIPNSSPPCDSCDSCDGFSPVTSCRKPSRAVEGAGPYAADGLASPERGGAQCAHWAEGSGVAICIPRLRRGRRPRRPASFVLGSRSTDRHTNVATLVRDDRPSAYALRACKSAFPP